MERRATPLLPAAARRARAAGLVAALGLLAGAARADLPEIKKQGRLRVLAVIVPGEPEFFALHASQPPGFEHEVLRGFAELHGLELEVVQVPAWDALLGALVQGKGDLIAGRFTATESRRKEIAFSVEVFPTRNVVVTRAPRPRVATLDELRGLRVGVVKGTSIVEALAAAQVPAEKLDTSIPSGGSLQALRAGRIDASVIELPDAIVAQRKDAQLQVGVAIGPPAIYAFGMRKADVALKRACDSYLFNLRLTPSWNQLVSKYFGSAAAEILKKARAE